MTTFSERPFVCVKLVSFLNDHAHHNITYLLWFRGKERERHGISSCERGVLCLSRVRGGRNKERDYASISVKYISLGHPNLAPTHSIKGISEISTPYRDRITE